MYFISEIWDSELVNTKKNINIILGIFQNWVYFLLFAKVAARTYVYARTRRA